MKKNYWGVLVGLVVFAGCDNPPPVSDGGTDSAIANTIDQVPLSQTLNIPGLQSPVDVVTDTRGYVHIYGQNLHDVYMAEGYMMSVDRFPQMEFIRRAVTGRLAEALGPDQLEDDIDSRTLGFRRQGIDIYNSLGEDSVSKRAADAFVAGINAYIARIRSGEITQDEVAGPGLEVFRAILACPCFGDWVGADVFAMARYQSYALSWDADSDIQRTQALAAMRTAFPADSNDSNLSSRSGFFADLFSYRQARDAYTRDGFPNVTTDTGTRAFLPRNRRGIRTRQPELPARGLLDRALARVRRFERLTNIMGDEHRGSNNWVVAASRSQGGSPILANDPHLSLSSPPIWWHVHLNTARAGGEAMLDVEGIAFAGLPGVVLGYNRNLAWGATTAGYDVTDAYHEQVTRNQAGQPVSVLFNGEQVNISILSEQISVLGNTEPYNLRLEVVPHHGVIISHNTDDNTAISVRYTGDVPTDELSFFLNLGTASNVEQALAAQNTFRVGSQNMVYADISNIAWSSESRIPQREAGACSFAIDDQGTVTGYSPIYVLPGQGDHEWTEDLSDRFVPHDINPERGYIGTANQDNVGVTEDGNPCNDGYYIGGDFDPGWREYRILEGLNTLTTRGNVTTEEMITLQAATKSSLGERLRTPFVQILENTSAVTDLTAEQIAQLADVRARLTAWSLETPTGVGSTDAAVIADSVATSIFNMAVTRILPRMIGDEYSLLPGISRPTEDSARLLEVAVTSPRDLFTFDEGRGDTVLWDDITTTERFETKNEIVIRGFVDALTLLTRVFGADLNTWRWGELHVVRFGSLIPVIGTDRISIPAADSATPNGLPRHGDYGAVDVGNFGLFNPITFADDAAFARWRAGAFRHGSGASQRLVVQITENGPVAYNALPGGQNIQTASPHHADEAEYWIRNQAPSVAFLERDVARRAERRVQLSPAQDD